MITKEKVVEALKQVFDPEIPVNIWDLGLIYEIQIRGKDTVWIRLTMTSPACPYAPMLLADVEKKVKEKTKAGKVELELTFDPAWTPEKMSAEGKAQLEMLS